MAFLHYRVKEITFDISGGGGWVENQLHECYNASVPYILWIRLGRPERLNDLPKVTLVSGSGT